MKTFKIAIIIFIIALIYGAGFFTHYKIGKSEKIYLKGTTKTVTKIIRVPKTIIEYKEAYKTPIAINGYVKNNVLHVTASDGWKQSKKGFMLGSKGNWKVYLTIGGVGILVGAGVGYGIYKSLK